MSRSRTIPNLAGYEKHIKETANLFALSKIAVYPVSGAGVMNFNIGMADSAGAGSAGGTGHFGTAADPTSSLTSESSALPPPSPAWSSSPTPPAAAPSPPTTSAAPCARSSTTATSTTRSGTRPPTPLKTAVSAALK